MTRGDRRVAVIGATGTIGRAVTTELLSGGDCDVIAISRTADVSSVPLGARPLRADLTVPASLDAALRGIDAVFLVWTAPADAAAAAIDTIARHVKRLVFLSAPHKTAHPFFQQPNPMAKLMAAVEALIECSNVEWTIVRPGMLASNSIAWWAPQIRAADVVRWPYAQAATSPMDERDIATVATRVLRGGYAGGDYVLTGPESLTQAEQVEILGEVIGRHLVLRETSPNESPLPQMLLQAWAAAVGIPAYVTDTIAKITGRPARTFRQWATDHADAFR
ncbi:MAG TPA: NAD(P)H-binding protein [Thermoanaerobaculia bacterium]|nr:NAD(P)H-binding protein [Thermoanaerobaculia bacterium]